MFRKNIGFIMSMLFFTTMLVYSDDDILKCITDITKDKAMARLLTYPVKISVSPSKRFVFVFARGSEPYADDDELKKDALKRDFVINGFTFSKGEYQWWFIFDFQKKKIILKGSKLVLLQDVIWREDHDYFIFNFGMGGGTNLEFYNIKDVNTPAFYLEAFYKNNKSIVFLDNTRIIAYQYVYKQDDFSGVDTDIGIKIRDLAKQKEIATINPGTTYGVLQIMKWESEHKLIYREVNKKQGIDNVKSFVLK